MAVTGESTSEHDAIGAVFERAQNVNYVYPTCARHLNDLYRRRILNTQTASEIGGVVSAMATAKCDNLWIVF
jgi:hypothetical protein